MFNRMNVNRGFNIIKGMIGRAGAFAYRHPYVSIGGGFLAGSIGLSMYNSGQRRNRYAGMGFSDDQIGQIMSGSRSPGRFKSKDIEMLREGGYNQGAANMWVNNNMVYPGSR